MDAVSGGVIPAKAGTMGRAEGAARTAVAALDPAQRERLALLFARDDARVRERRRQAVRDKRAYRRWTPEEDALIREHYPTRGPRWDGWARLMPDREPTYDSVARRAGVLGIGYRKFKGERGKK